MGSEQKPFEAHFQRYAEFETSFERRSVLSTRYVLISTVNFVSFGKFFTVKAFGALVF